MSYYLLLAAVVTLDAIGLTAGIRCLLGSQECSCGQECQTKYNMWAVMKAIDKEECPEAKQFQKSPGFTELQCPNADDLCVREVNLLMPRSPPPLVGKVSYRQLRGACVSKKIDPKLGLYYQPVTLNDSIDVSQWGWPASWPGISNFGDRSYVCSDVWWPVSWSTHIKFEQAYVFCLCKTELCNLDPKSMGLPPARPPASSFNFTLDPGVADNDDLLLFAQLTSDKTRPKLERDAVTVIMPITSSVTGGTRTTRAPTSTGGNAGCGDFPDSEACRDEKSRNKNSAPRIVVANFSPAVLLLLTFVGWLMKEPERDSGVHRPS